MPFVGENKTFCLPFVSTVAVIETDCRECAVQGLLGVSFEGETVPLGIIGSSF